LQTISKEVIEMAKDSQIDKKAVRAEKTKLILPFFTLRYLKEIGFPMDDDNEIINHIQGAEINRLYNARIPKSALAQLAQYAQTALKLI